MGKTKKSVRHIIFVVLGQTMSMLFTLTGGRGRTAKWLGGPKRNE